MRTFRPAYLIYLLPGGEVEVDVAVNLACKYQKIGFLVSGLVQRVVLVRDAPNISMIVAVSCHVSVSKSPNMFTVTFKPKQQGPRLRPETKLLAQQNPTL